MTDSVSKTTDTSSQPAGSNSKDAATIAANKTLVTFSTEKRTASVALGSSLQEAAAGIESMLEHPCGGRGICGKCRVQAHGLLSDPSEAEYRLLSPQELADGIRLSCQATVLGPAEVKTDVDIVSSEQSILMEGEGASIAIQPRCQKIYLQLEPPTLEESRDDEQRITDALTERGIYMQPMPPALVRQLPGFMRPKDGEHFCITVTILKNHWIHIESGDTSARFFGIAVDVGTTTVVVSLHDLHTGEELGRRGLTNKQISCGGDVISRMAFSREHESGRETLHRLILDTIETAIDELCSESKVSRDEIAQIVAVGNSVMETLLLGIDPSPIAVSPFIVVSTQAQDWSAPDAGFNLPAHTVVTTGPLIASYVGGDIIADMLASEVYEADAPTLLIDIGTNAEIVLADRERIVACASPAGPAFEGAEIRQGMRAAPGAIERVSVGQECFEIETIGNTPPRGLCGSGLIDALACLLEVGAVDPNGRLLPPEDSTAPDWVRRALTANDEGVRIRIAESKGSNIELWADDIRKLQLAKGAVKVGIKILCHQWGIEATELDRILLAGAFGNHLRETSLVRSDMIPALPTGRTRFIGNTAWMGAKMLLLSKTAFFQAEKLRQHVTYYELSGRSDFQMEFGMSMLFDNNWNYTGF